MDFLTWALVVDPGLRLSNGIDVPWPRLPSFFLMAVNCCRDTEWGLG